MPSLAFACPLWPATRCALADLTRLALAALVLAVGLGAAAASDPTSGPDATDRSAPPIAAVASRPLTSPMAAGVITAPVAAVRPGITSVRVFPHLSARALAATRLPRPEPVDITAEPAAATIAARFAVTRPASSAGEPTRRGPPVA